jgi:hypothetical protein
MIAILWEYSVPSEHFAEFERHYNSSGTWVIFFRRSADYHGTVLLRDADTPGRYLTLDHWSSFEAYQSFCAEHEAEYRRIDAMCASLTASERRLGLFHAL